MSTPISASAPTTLHIQNQPETEQPVSLLTAAPKVVDFQTERFDWMMFRTLDTLGQMAGVSASRLRRLALKELVDNALDAGAKVEISPDKRGGYIIEDDGPGIDGTPEEIASLFSINRPLRSSKQWRRPQRGALGNGLRVVAGSLISSGGGHLVVTTRGRRLEITPLYEGGSTVVSVPAPERVGTKIEIKFGPDMPEDHEALTWASWAILNICHRQRVPGQDIRPLVRRPVISRVASLQRRSPCPRLHRQSRRMQRGEGRRSY
jgi:hypothetical protein